MADTRQLAGRATPSATHAYAGHHGATRVHPDTYRHARPLDDCALSNIGLGTYLGAEDDATDEAVAVAVADCLDRGVNVVDTAINYRNERSERSVGEGLRRAVAAGVEREAVYVSTKGGFLVPSVEAGIVAAGDVAADCHAMTPDYLAWCLDRSRANLGLQTIDLYYIHNPETQLGSHDTDAWLGMLGEAMRALEERADDAAIGHYGIATWNGLRIPPDAHGHVPLERVVEVARDVGGAGHRFAAVQMPLNMGMPQALVEPTQVVDGERVTALEAAHELELAVFTSASAAQGRMLGRFPEELATDMPGAEGSATRALLQWTRSCEHVTSALVGMTQRGHRDEDLGLLGVGVMDGGTVKMMITG